MSGKYSKSDYDDLCYSQHIGEFSDYSDYAFENHLKRLNKCKKHITHIKGNEQKLKAILQQEGLWYGTKMMR